MSKIAIVFHSSYGHARKIAEAVASGSRGDLVRKRVVAASARLAQ
jgi:flavodoxin